MKKAKVSSMFIVVCPHCNDNVEVSPHDVGDEYMCSWSSCNEDFIVPENKPLDYLKVSA